LPRFLNATQKELPISHFGPLLHGITASGGPESGDFS
jgi:hypothetical protein